MPEISRLEEMGNVSVLKPEGLKEAHQSLVGLGSLGGHILEGDLPEDHIRANHPLCEVVVRGQSRNIEEGENLAVIFEEPLRESFPMRVRKRMTGEVKESFLEEARSSVKNPRRKPSPYFLQPVGIREDAPEFDPGHLILGRRVSDVFDFPLEMDETTLSSLACSVVGGKEVTHGDPLEIRGENFLGDFPSPAPSDAVEGKLLIHKDPEPMKDSGNLPAGLIPMDPGGLPDCFEDELFFDLEPLGKALEGLGESRIGDFKPAKLFEKSLDLGIRQAVVVFEKNRLNEDVRAQIPVGDFFQGIRRSLLLFTIRAPVAVADELRGFHLGWDNVLLDMLLKLRRKLGQGLLPTIRAALKGLMDGMVDEFGFVPGDAGMSHGSSEFLPALLQFPLEGCHTLKGGFELLFQLLVLFLESFVFPPKVKNFLNEIIFGFLGKEEFFLLKPGCRCHLVFYVGRRRKNSRRLIRTR